MSWFLQALARKAVVSRPACSSGCFAAPLAEVSEARSAELVDGALIIPDPERPGMFRSGAIRPYAGLASARRPRESTT